jgi:hypothetical protein
MIESFSVIAPVLSILGALLTTSLKAKPRLIGFAVWVVSNTMLAVWCVTVAQPWMLLMYATFCVISAWGIMTNARALKGTAS